ncbi:MAG: phosphotransferase [Chloroflexi bacterium]|nr:phosphotransferase [Chloroflexota bacterium]
MNLAASLDALRSAFPQLAIHTALPVDEGWDYIVIEVNGELIFRFPRRAEVRASLEKEILLLPCLAGKLSAAVPRFDYVHRGEPPFIGYPKIGGAPLDAAAAARPALARRLGALLGELHAVRLPWTVHRRLPLITAMDWRREYLLLHAALRARVFPLLTAEARPRAARLWEAHLKDAANFRIRLALIHGDLGAEHILCHPQADAIAGLIDWGDARTGDPALDFVGLLQTGGEAAVRLALEAYPHDLGKSFWSRLHFYNKITPFYLILHGLDCGEEQAVQDGLRQIHFLERHE